MTNKRHSIFAAICLLATLTAQSQPIGSIPSRVEIPKGKIVLSEGAEVLVTEISAGEWAARRLTLQKDGKPIWTSPLLDYLVTAQHVGKRNKTDPLRSGRQRQARLALPHAIPHKSIDIIPC